MTLRCPKLARTLGAFALLVLSSAAFAQAPTVSTASARHSDRDHHRDHQGLIVIAHRGASGYRPEHTLEAYRLAIRQGADFIEPDLVATKDGVLIARHENEISGTTDVAAHPEFASRKTTKVIDGVSVTGWFTEDFTLAELKTLRARERLPALRAANTRFDGMFEVPTLDEVLALVAQANERRREQVRAQGGKPQHWKPVGVYPETKHPSYFQGIGLPLEEPLVQTLHRHGYRDAQAPVFIQSFETANLRYLRSRTSVRLVQLVDANDLNPDGSLDFTKPYDKPYDWVVSGRAGLFKDLLTPAGLAEVRTYADGIGPWKYYLIPSACTLVNGACSDVNGDGAVNEADRKLLPATDIIANAHKLGLVVHPYTFRNEQRRLATDYAGNPVNEYLKFFDAGVDGVFSDFADTAVAARVTWKLKRDPSYARCLVSGRKCDRDD